MKKKSKIQVQGNLESSTFPEGKDNKEVVQDLEIFYGVFRMVPLKDIHKKHVQPPTIINVCDRLRQKFIQAERNFGRYLCISKLWY